MGFEVGGEDFEGGLKGRRRRDGAKDSVCARGVESAVKAMVVCYEDCAKDEAFYTQKLGLIRRAARYMLLYECNLTRLICITHQNSPYIFKISRLYCWWAHSGSK